jgi:hypothetical protein
MPRCPDAPRLRTRDSGPNSDLQPEPEQCALCTTFLRVCSQWLETKCPVSSGIVGRLGRERVPNSNMDKYLNKRERIRARPYEHQHQKQEVEVMV